MTTAFIFKKKLPLCEDSQRQFREEEIAWYFYIVQVEINRGLDRDEGGMRESIKYYVESNKESHLIRNT